jgi:hypothetical protein
MELTLFILWCFYAILEGWREGDYFHRVEVTKERGRLLHIGWTFQRFIVLCIIALTSFNWWLLALPLVFPFLHDGEYYTTRNYFNRLIYTKKYFAHSTTSTAITTKIFTPVVRTILFGLGILTIILWYIL